MSIKRFLICVIGILAFITACGNEQPSSGTYNPMYIDIHNGKRWLNYGILYGNAYTGSWDGTLSVLKQNEFNEEYRALFTIDKDDYSEEDIILGNREYIYIFNQDKAKTHRITAYKLINKKQKPIIIDDKELASIIKVYGASEQYIFASYHIENTEIFVKISNDLSKIYILKDSKGLEEQIKYLTYSVKELKSQ